MHKNLFLLFFIPSERVWPQINYLLKRSWEITGVLKQHSYLLPIPNKYFVAFKTPVACHVCLSDKAD